MIVAAAIAIIPTGAFLLKKPPADTASRELLVGCVFCAIDPLAPQAAVDAAAVCVRSLVLCGEGERLPFMDEQARRDYFKEDYGAALLAVERAVDAALCTGLFYEGERLFAAFCAVSSGRTENGADISSRYEALVSVESPDDALSLSFLSDMFFTNEQLCETLGIERATVGAAVKTERGAVLSISLGGASFSGAELYSRLSLASVCFSVFETDSGLRFICRGAGCNMGLSIFGAVRMAERGKSCEEILRHYFPEAEIRDERGENAA